MENLPFYSKGPVFIEFYPWFGSVSPASRPEPKASLNLNHSIAGELDRLFYHKAAKVYPKTRHVGISANNRFG